MRRPLCLIGLVYVAAVIIGMTVTVRDAPVYRHLDGQRVAVAGYVDWKEQRISGGREVLVITLKDAVILEEDQIVNLQQILSDSRTNSPEHTTDHIWKNIGKLPGREDAQGIEGVLCYMSADREEVPRMGSFVIMRGTFYAFSHASNPGEFDSAQYYRILNMQGRVMQAECAAEGGGYSAFREELYQIREYVSMLLSACFDARDASVMKAMLLGEKGTLDEEIKNLYQRNGIIHILAISGLHLSILGMGLYKMLGKAGLPKVVSIIVSMAAMYCYGTMTGMGTSMIRACVMFALHLCAQLIGRTYDLFTALMTAALIVLLRQPLYLLHSGFLFSFGAVCGIGILVPAVERNLLTGSRAEKILLSGAAISAATLPVYLRFYYEFPPYSVLLNLFVIPCMTLVLVCGLCAAGLAVCYLPLGMLASLPCHLMLCIYEKSCEWCSKLPGSKWVTGCPEIWQVVLYLGILAGVVVWEHKMPKMLFWQGVLCALCVFTIRLPQGLEITMVDVGQGDCIYLAEDGGMKLLIDGGSTGKKDVENYQILPFLKYRGAAKLDAVFVTHPDSDHENGIRAWLEHYEENGIAIGMLILPDVDERSKNTEYRKLETLAAQKGVPVHYIHAGEALRGKKLTLTCIHPEQGWYSEDVNAYSIVLHLTYGGFSALFTGDLEGEGEQLVLDRIESGKLAGEAGGRLTVLKVAHHGSRNSTSAQFLAAVRPCIALISAGEDNSYGHPHEETLTRLCDCRAKVFITYETGAVTLRTDGRKVTAETFVRYDLTPDAKTKILIGTG